MNTKFLSKSLTALVLVCSLVSASVPIGAYASTVATSSVLSDGGTHSDSYSVTSIGTYGSSSSSTVTTVNGDIEITLPNATSIDKVILQNLNVTGTISVSMPAGEVILNNVVAANITSDDSQSSEIILKGSSKISGVTLKNSTSSSNTSSTSTTTATGSAATTTTSSSSDASLTAREKLQKTLTYAKSLKQSDYTTASWSTANLGEQEWVSQNLLDTNGDDASLTWENQVLTNALSLLVKTTESSKVTTTAATTSTSASATSGNTVSDSSTLTTVLSDSLDTFDTSKWAKSDGWTNGGVFNCIWRAANISFNNSLMTLKLDTDTDTATGGYSGAEYRSVNKYGFGKYSTSMKPAKNIGTVSSFFTYTGPSDGNPWDEIDIEFLGKDTTKVQFNYYTNGVGNHEYLYDLGFDASEGFHTYSFDWENDHIAWFVDGKEVHRVTDNIPTHPGKIMANLWNGTGVDAWLGVYDGKTPLKAQYASIKYEQSES